MSNAVLVTNILQHFVTYLFTIVVMLFDFFLNDSPYYDCRYIGNI